MKLCKIRNEAEVTKRHATDVDDWSMKLDFAKLIQRAENRKCFMTEENYRKH